MIALVVAVLLLALAIACFANVRLSRRLEAAKELSKVSRIGTIAANNRARHWQQRAENAETSLQLVLNDTDALGGRRSRMAVR